MKMQHKHNRKSCVTAPNAENGLVCCLCY